jgi:hypothetical protein
MTRVISSANVQAKEWAIECGEPGIEGERDTPWGLLDMGGMV